MTEPVCKRCGYGVPHPLHSGSNAFESSPHAFEPAPEPKGVKQKDTRQVDLLALTDVISGLDRLGSNWGITVAAAFDEIRKSRETIAALTRRAEEAERQRDDIWKDAADLRVKLAETEQLLKWEREYHRNANRASLEWHAEAEKLRAETASVAERQREACYWACVEVAPLYVSDGGEHYVTKAVRATPLVTASLALRCECGKPSTSVSGEPMCAECATCGGSGNFESDVPPHRWQCPTCGRKKAPRA